VATASRQAPLTTVSVGRLTAGRLSLQALCGWIHQSNIATAGLSYLLYRLQTSIDHWVNIC